MDTGIWATWYDLPDDRRETFLSWLHGDYLPALAAHAGHVWVAHYETSGGGHDMATLSQRLARAEAGTVETGTQYLLLVGASSPHAFFQPDAARLPDRQGEETRAMLAHQLGVRSAIFAEEARVNGPEFDKVGPGGPPAPAIQMGSFRIKTPEDEFQLGAWYAQYRLPAMARMPGCVATRKLVSAAGWAKHGILYEFTSLEARLEHFERPHEALALDETEWTGRIVRLTVHAPGSPSIGRRTWPAA